MKQFEHVIKICLNRGEISQNKLHKISNTSILYGKRHNYIPLVYASIHCESKNEKKISKLRKGDDRIQILQLARSRSKK